MPMSTPAAGIAQSSPLLTDIYQLTMSMPIIRRHAEPAVFEFFVVACLMPANFLSRRVWNRCSTIWKPSFHADEIEWLASTERFSPTFLKSCRCFASQEVYAMPKERCFRQRTGRARSRAAP